MGKFDNRKVECAECERKGNPEEFVFCGGCEEFYCYDSEGGCKWINKDKEMYICEACYPRECETAFIIDSSEKKIKLEDSNKYIFLGQDLEEGIEILKSEKYLPRYRLDREEKKIIKYGKTCGIYLLFDDDNKIKAIGMWTGLHKTVKDITFYSEKEDMIEAYGDNFIFHHIGGYINSYYYPEENLKFILTAMGTKREIVTEIILS